MSKQTPEQFCRDVLAAQDRAANLEAAAAGLRAARDAVNMLTWWDVAPEASDEDKRALASAIIAQWRRLDELGENYAALAKDARKYALLMRRRLARKGGAA